MPASHDLDGVDVAVEPLEGVPTSENGEEPASFSPSDPVPLFRTDLRVARGASPGLFEVTDARRGKTFTLYEFELSVARLLDGRRRVSEVVESGVRLGIPIDSQGLYKFVRQMWHYGFLAPRGAELGPEDGAETWGRRERWDEATRTLFETGVRLMRSGRSPDAAGYFEAILDAHPTSPEATEMLAVIARGKPVPPNVGEGSASPPPVRRRGRRAALAAAALVVAGAGLAAFRLAPGEPPPRAATTAAEPAGASSSQGVPSAVAPREPPRPAWRSAPVDVRRLAPLSSVIAPGGGAIHWTKGASASVRSGEQLGEVRVPVAGGGASGEIARRIAELERLAAQDPVYRDFLEKARREQKRATRRRTRALAIVAPAAGVLALPAELPRRAEEGEILGWIVDPAAWRLGLALEGEPPPGDAECKVVGDGPGDVAPCRLLVASPTDGGHVAVTVEVREAEARWIGRAQSPYVRFAEPGADGTTP